MCRSAAEGGRRCHGSGSGASSAAPQSRSFAAADVELRAAQDAVCGGPAPVVGGLPSILTGAIARGGDVVLARQMVVSAMVGRGVSPKDAVERVDRLEAAHRVWLDTPEDGVL